MLQAMIVDDEELSLKRLMRILTESGKIASCRSFLNPSEAYDYAKSNHVDIAFLDISMPEICGMQLSSLLQELDEAIHIVFVTGYDEYAVQAFELSALDYLLKPVTAERVSKTLAKAGKRYGTSLAERPELKVQLFNGLKIYRNDMSQEPIRLRSPKTEELFAFLICKKIVSREEIIDTLWNGLEQEKAMKNLNSTLYYIRKSIDYSKTGGHIIADRFEVKIEESRISCDLYEMEDVMKQIKRASSATPALFGQAEALYTGQLLRGKAYEWAGNLMRRLEQEYIGILEQAAKYYLDRCEWAESLHYFSEALRLDPLREDIAHEVIRLYMQAGRKNEAIRQYRELETVLEQELGVKPDAAIQDLFQKPSL